jgi:hypothetical protein
VLDRLTYANVVATLALFIALGGSAYAATQITSKQVKNRSLSGVDLRRNTIKGTEVNESKLGQVPSAAAADQAQRAVDATNATNASNATNATSAANATNATNATNAGLATNSLQLDGQGASFFEKSSRTTFARATGQPANPQSEGTVLQWDPLGILVTVPTQGGCSTPEQVTLHIKNTRSNGPDLLFVRENGATLSIPSGGSSTIACSGEAGHDGHWQGVAGYAAEESTLFFDCQRLANDVRCLSTRSDP